MALPTFFAMQNLLTPSENDDFGTQNLRTILIGKMCLPKMLTKFDCANKYPRRDID
jgi:hypothetical protein